MEAPVEVVRRLNKYIAKTGEAEPEKVGGGVDGFVWMSKDRDAIKVFRRERPFRHELAVYERLQERGLSRLRGFWIPELQGFDDELWVLRMSFVKPPFLIDFGAAVLDAKPADFPLDSREWRDEKRRLYGAIDWPEIERLLESLMQHGIFYVDVHKGNIRARR